MAKNKLDPIVFEDARIGFRNFSGNEGKYNKAGDRNFLLFIDDREVASQMVRDGWNIKELKPRDEQEEPQPYLQVTVSYKNVPPKIFLVTSKGKTPMDEDTVNILDFAEIKTVDLIVNPYHWEVPGTGTGVKAYVKSMYLTIVEDYLDRKYVEVPDSATNTLGVNEDDAPF